MGISRRRILTPVMAAMALLASCTQTQREVSRGDGGAAAERLASGGAAFATFGPGELQAACAALQGARRFTLFFQCYEELDRRVRRDGGRIVGDEIPLFSRDAVTLNRAMSKGFMLSMRSDVYLNQGRLEKAHSDASEVARITRSQPYFMGDEPDEDLFGPLRKRDQMRALTFLGLIEAEWGDPVSASSRLAELESVDVSDYDSISAGLDAEKRGWLAKLHLALGQSEKAYQELTAKEDLGLNGFLSDLNKLALDVNPFSYLISAAALGTLDFDDVFFVFQFEPRFLLHRAELETGRLDAARAGFEGILNEPRVKGFGTIHWQALYGRGRVALAKGDLAAAVADFESAVRVIEAQRRSIDTEAGRVSFVGDKQDVYGDLIDALFRQGRVSEAFAYAERGKARALVDILATKSTFGSAAGAAALSQMTRAESQQVRAARDRGQDLSRTGGAASAGLRAANPELASLVTVPAYDATELQALVPTGETLVEYYKQGDQLFAFVVTKEDVRMRRLDGARVDALVSRFRREVSRPGGVGYRAPGRALYDALIRPIAGDVRTERVTIVPHGSLHYLAWAALPTNGGFLVDRWEIRIAPSASTLAFVGEAPSGDGALAIGNPALPDPRLDLPGAEAEAKAVAAALPASTLLIGAAATETAVRAKGVRSDVIHLASHGVFDPTAPLSSALLLTADARNDGRLTASEMYDLDLDASLVTLSACETGLGRVQSGDDVVGLTRGLLFSGADSVIASLWLVDDAATGRLMSDLYQSRAKGGSTSAALRRAQRSMMKSAKAHPYYWAAFQVTGSR